MSITLALDKQSARRIDANGYLHVEPNPISKATVNPYKGSEIPGCEQLGLDPNKVYYLLRDPKELKKAAPTFNNLPILSKHIPVSSFDMDKPEVKALYVGSTGTDAEFDGKYLNNTLVLHAKSAIDDIQAKKKHELSCAYRYQPDMTPGTFEGQHYDGIMRDIQGNHVALVTEGRAGHDVKVMDSKNGGAKVVDYRKVSTAMGKDSAEKVRAMLFGPDQKAMDGSITKEVQGSDYETAEAAAKSAGTLAGMQPTPENRKQAARLSREAARLHRSAGFAKQAKYWDEVAAEFEKPAGGAKDSNPEGINQYSGGGGGKEVLHGEKPLSRSQQYSLDKKANLERVKNLVDEEAKRQGNRGNIKVTNAETKFMLNGEEHLQAGSFNRWTNKVTINASHLMGATDEQVRGVVAHELGHKIFEPAWDKGEPPFGTFVPSGPLAKYTSSPESLQTLQREDGVTPYSREWWDNHNNSVASAGGSATPAANSLKSAMHETFAELHYLHGHDRARFNAVVQSRPTWGAVYRDVMKSSRLGEKES